MMKFDSIKAIIFDMDGLLVASEEIYHRVEFELFRPFGVKKADYFDKFMGMKAEEVFAQIKEELNLKQSVDELIEQRLVKMEEAFRSELKLMPYAYETLKKYYKVYSLALCSSSQRELVGVALEKFKIADFFSIVISGDDVKVGKPHPEIFLKASSYLGLQPSEVLVLEDAPKGVEAAKRAGMHCVAIPNKYTMSCDFGMAEAVLQHLGQLELPV